MLKSGKMNKLVNEQRKCTVLFMMRKVYNLLIKINHVML